MLFVWINDFWDILIIIIISWEFIFKGVGKSGRGSNFSFNFVIKIIVRKVENL